MEGLEQKLIEDKWISLQQLALATKEAKRLGKSIWAALARLGILSEEDIAIFFAQVSGIPFVRISDYQLKEEVVRLIDEDFCRENLILPLFKIKDMLFIASANPLDIEMIDYLIKKTGCDIKPLFASSSSITQAQDRYYGLQDRFFKASDFITSHKSTPSMLFCPRSVRLPLSLPVWISCEEEQLCLSYSGPLQAITKEISSDGMAVGLEVFLFIPEAAKVSLEFRLNEKSSCVHVVKAKAEVIYCRMQKSLRYFLGIKFLEIEESGRQELLKLAEKT